MSGREYKEYVRDAVNEVIRLFGTIEAVAEMRHIDKSTLCKWKNGRATPLVSTFLKYFPEYKFDGIDSKVDSSKPDMELEEADVCEEVLALEEPINCVCDDCIHNNVCRLTDTLRSLKKDIMTTYQGRPSPIVIDVLCEEHVSRIDMKKANHEFVGKLTRM